MRPAKMRLEVEAARDRKAQKKPEEEDVGAWTVDDVQAWLVQQGPPMSQPAVLEAFRTHGVDGAALMVMTPRVLRLSSVISDEKVLECLEDVRRKAREVNSDQLEAMKLQQEFDAERELEQYDAETARLVHEAGNDEARVAQILEGRERAAPKKAAKRSDQDGDGAKLRDLAKAVEPDNKLTTVATHKQLPPVREESIRKSQSDTALPKEKSTAASPRRPKTDGEEGDAEGQAPRASPSTSGAADAAAAAADTEETQKEDASPDGEEPGEPGDGEEREKSIAAGPRQCMACFAKKPEYKLACEHSMCQTCLASFFKNAVTDPSLWPPRCCQQELDISLAQKVMGEDEFKDFDGKREEASAKQKTYCVNPRCSKFLNLDVLGTDEEQYPCPDCGQRMCLRCKSGAHPGVTCAAHKDAKEDEGDRTLDALARGKEWKRCGGCGSVVERNGGCNHMTCRCRYEFCYRCGKRWHTCGCELFDVPELDREEQRRVAILEQLHRRRVEEAERQRIRQMLENQECRHRRGWKKVEFDRRHRGGRFECGNCGYTLRHYCFQCKACKEIVCHTCRHHRLG